MLPASPASATPFVARSPRVRLGGRPHDVKIAGRTVVVANEGAARLDLVSLQGKRRGRIPLRANPHDIAVQPGTRRVWASLDGDDRLAVVNLSTRHVRYVSTGDRPHDLLFAPDGRLFVTDWSGALHVFSRKGKQLATRKLGEESHHLAFTPDGSQVWVTDNALRRIFVVATHGLRVLARLRFPGAPHHVAITPDGRYAVVADHSRGSLVIYRVATRRRVGTVAVGPGPHGVWAVPLSDQLSSSAGRRSRLSRRAFTATRRLEPDIDSAAISGRSTRPKAGSNTPAAMGRATEL